MSDSSSTTGTRTLAEQAEMVAKATRTTHREAPHSMSKIRNGATLVHAQRQAATLKRESNFRLGFTGNRVYVTRTQGDKVWTTSGRFGTGSTERSRTALAHLIVDLHV